MTAPSLTALGLLAAASCSGSSSGEFAGDLFIESCSLGCTDGTGGSQVFCNIVNVTENLEISVLFSEPIDPASVNSSTVQVIDVNNGTTPDGLRFVDPLDPRRVIFRPAVSFDSGLDFSFERNRSYEILIPGVVQGDPGPYIESVAGKANQSRMACTVLTSEGVSDSVPGDPIVDVFVDRVTAFDAMGQPSETERTQLGTTLANVVTDVWRESNVYFEFNELMFLPSVANNATQASPFIRVDIDKDGILATSAGGDRQPIPGAYTVSVDQVSLTTSLLFEPTGFIPSAGDAPSLLIVRIPTNVTDVVQNPVTSATGGGILVGIPEVLSFDPILLPDGDGENFDDSAGTPGSLEDAFTSGPGWGSGRLSPALTGGSGRHGALRIPAGETVVLNTDSQEFPFTGSQLNVIGNPDVTGDYPRTLTVTDGVFEFTTVQIGANGRLVFEGANPARMLVRGRCAITSGAIVDVSGTSPGIHDSTVPLTADLLMADPGYAAGGPGGARGGLGADRADFTGNLMVSAGGLENPGAVRNGRAGSGVGSGLFGGGGGGTAFPAVYPVSNTSSTATVGEVGMNIAPDPASNAASGCYVLQIANPGGGGGYALPGGSAVATPEVPLTEAPVAVATAPASGTSGGSVAGLGLAAPDLNNAGYSTRLLRYQDGNLRGGAGGGGGGNHPYASRTNLEGSTDPIECFQDLFASVFFTRWVDHSGASGGGGGGAIEVLAGRDVDLDGIIDVRGGDGGGAMVNANSLGAFAMPGGAGSGGAVRVRSPLVDIGPTGRLRVGGGNGGIAPWTQFGMGIETSGGVGSPGLVRIEDAASAIAFMTERDNVEPFDTLMPDDSLQWLSVAPGFVDATTIGLQRPESLNGSTSCWMRPPGAFQNLNPDADSGPTLEEQGWTMDVVLDDGAGGTTLRPFRGTTAEFPVSWVDTYGNLLGYDLGLGETASPIVVRFQGGVSVGPSLSDPCNVNADVSSGLGGEVQNGSLTPWVSHPADFNLLTDAVGNTFTPTMIRYVVLFDRTNDGISDQPGLVLTNEGVLGVDNLRIAAQPE